MSGMSGHVIICGFGRVGELIGEVGRAPHRSGPTCAAASSSRRPTVWGVSLPFGIGKPVCFTTPLSLRPHPTPTPTRMCFRPPPPHHPPSRRRC
jgi:hypothetical protein